MARSRVLVLALLAVLGGTLAAHAAGVVAPTASHNAALRQYAGPTPAPAQETAGVQITSPTTKSCVSRRLFTIRIRSHKRDPLVSATVKLNGKTVKVIKRSRRLTAKINLRGLPAGRVTVKIKARTRSGKVVNGTRRYKTCTPREQGGLPPLR